MTTDRSYRSALPVSVALECIRGWTGQAFDPDLAEEFCTMVEDEHDELEVRADRAKGASPSISDPVAQKIQPTG